MNSARPSLDAVRGLPVDAAQPRTKDALWESEERFSSAFEHAPIGMALVSREGRWLRVNRALCDLVGYSETELLARTFQGITHADDITADMDQVRRMIDGEIRSYQMEKRYIHRHGHLVTVLLSVSLVRDNQGQPNYFISQIQDITEQKRAEDELRWKTAFLEAQVDSALDGTMVVDNQGKKILQNQRHRELWKTPAHIHEKNDYAEQLQFFTAQTKNPREFAEKVAHLYAHPDEVSRDEVELIDGTILDRYSSPVRDNSGKHYGRIWTFRDITDRKRTENALRESNEKFQQLADNITDVFWIRSPDLREVHYVSRAFAQIWGRSVESLYENPLRWPDYILPEDRDRVLGAFAALSGDSRSLDIEYRIVRPDGEIRWVRVRGFQVRDAADRLIRHTGIVTDITEQRRSEDALRESERRFSGAFEHAPIGLALVSPEGRWLRVNRALCDLVGYSETELLTRSVQDITPPGDLAADMANRRRMIAGEIHTCQMEKRYVHRSGHLVMILLSVSLVRDGQGQPHYFISQIQDITERKRAEVELRGKTAFLEAQVDSALDGILVVDGQRRAILQNERLRALWKIPPQVAKDYVEQLQFVITQTKNPEAFAEKVNYLYAHLDEVSRDEIELIDGTILDRYSSPVRDKAGNYYGRIWTFRDITERKRAEERIAEQAALIDQTHDVIAVRDLNDRIIFWNKGAERLYGWTTAEVSGCQVNELIQPDPETFQEALKAVFRDGKWTGEMQKSTKAGAKLTLHSRWTLLRDARNEPKSILVIGTDITERKRAEDELRKREDRFRLLIENASDLITILNGEGQIRYQSPSSKRLLGYEPKDLVGRNAFEFMPPADAALAADALKRALVNPSAPVSAEYRFRHQDGTWRLLQSVGRNIPGEAPDGFIVVNSRDITESRSLEAQFRQAQKMEAFGQLASGVAHDFNNILAVIQLLTGLLLENPALPQSERDFASEIKNAAKRGANLTRQLLLFSQRQTLQQRDLDLNETVTHVCKMLHRILGEDVPIQFKLAPHPLVIHADTSMMDQILLNLAVNARDAMPKGGQLVVETSTFVFDEVTAAQTAQARPGSFACLSVSDTGCGIPAENLSRIFEPFFTTKDVGKGTGLGLATIFGIVRRHKGWINVYSEVGRGTTFRVYFPRLTKVLNETAGETAPAQVTGGNETILLVEDDETLRAATRITLSHLGYRVLEAPNGIEALETWQQHRSEINLLLTDLVMPGGMTGRELAAQILRQDPTLKVLYVSGYSAETASKDFRLEEGVNFLTKPFEAHRLAQALRHCLDKNQPTK